MKMMVFNHPEGPGKLDDYKDNIVNTQIPAGDDFLRLPFAVNIKELSDEQVVPLLEQMHNVLGARYFRDMELLIEVIQEQREATQKPTNFLYGPYLAVTPKQNGTLRLNSVEKVEGGCTVYAIDQVTDLLEKIRKNRKAETSANNYPSP